VLPAVDLNNQPGFKTNKIDDVRTNRQLAPKRQTHKPMRSQPLPNPRLGIGHIAAKRASTRAMTI